jgi:hypothetical protein
LAPGISVVGFPGDAGAWIVMGIDERAGSNLYFARGSKACTVPLRG